MRTPGLGAGEVFKAVEEETNRQLIYQQILSSLRFPHFPLIFCGKTQVQHLPKLYYLW